MSSPYQPPPLPVVSPSAAKSIWGWNVFFASILTIGAPVIGLVWTMVRMKGAFDALGSSGADVGALAGHIGEVLVSSSIGIMLGILGLVWLIVSLIVYCSCPKVPLVVQKP